MEINFRRVNQFFGSFLRVVGNLKLAIGLLLVISFVISLGTVIEQERSISFYKLNYPTTHPILGLFTYEIILFFGLDHVYKTSWFFLLLCAFGSSLISCTVIRQIPSLKMAKIWKFLKGDKTGTSVKNIKLISDSSLGRLSYLLRRHHYNVVQQGFNLYAYKGFIGKVGPIFVHFSIIVILFGCIYSSMTGFVSQEVIQKGDLFYPQNIISSGPLSRFESGFVSYVKDFRIAYSDWGLVDQFYSDLQIRDRDLNLVLNKTIFVNEPLKYKEEVFYQTDWGISFVKVFGPTGAGRQIRLREFSLKNGSRFWIGSLGNWEVGEKLVVLEDLTGKFFIYDSKKELLAIEEVGGKVFVDGVDIRFGELIPSTGIQVKSDLGIGFIYFGFLVLTVSVVLSYTSYSQIWVLQKGKYLYINASTNRGVYFFEKFILGMVKEA